MNNSGQPVIGSRVVGVCAACDAHDPASRDLIAYFAIHGRVTEETTEIFSELFVAWAAAVRPGVDEAGFDADVAAWRRGDVDD